MYSYTYKSWLTNYFLLKIKCGEFVIFIIDFVHNIEYKFQ